MSIKPMIGAAGLCCLAACSLAGKPVVQTAAETMPAIYAQVYRHDGSRQCEGGTGIPAAEMQRELQGIRVYAAEHLPYSGLAVPAACGYPSGAVNRYTIDARDIKAAQQKGFLLWQD